MLRNDGATALILLSVYSLLSLKKIGHPCKGVADFAN